MFKRFKFYMRIVFVDKETQLMSIKIQCHKQQSRDYNNSTNLIMLWN